jgi:thiol-disulfide isomerase/thioredoxin
MRKLLAFVLLASSLGAAQLPRKAGEFVIQMPDGPAQLLSAYQGKTVVLAFMYTTCPHCKHTAQVLAQVQKEYAGKGVQILGAAFDAGSAFRVQQFNKELGLNFPCGYAGEPAVLQFVQQPPAEPYFVPILVFIDKTGMVRSQYVGDEKFLDKQEVNIRAEIDKLLKTGITTSRSVAKKTPKS